MAKVTVKIPKGKNKVKIIKDKNRIEDVLSHYNLPDFDAELEDNRANDIDKEVELPDEVIEEEIKSDPNSKKENEKHDENEEDCENLRFKKCDTVFSQRYTITDSNQPITISLDKVKEESLSISEARVEIQNSYDRGFNDGQDAAKAIYDNELKDKISWIKRIDSVIHNMEIDFQKELKKFEEIIVDTSIKIAEEIINKEVKENSTIIIEQVKKAIEYLDSEKIFNIKVAPEDAEILKSIKSELVHDPNMISRTRIIPDTHLKAGDSILETEAGMIDARISTQLERIKQNLENELSK